MFGANSARNLLCLTTLLIFGCKQTPPPVAHFRVSGQMITPAALTFSNDSQNADRYQWDFGDGRTSIQQSPSMTFEKNGKFVVTLIAFQTEKEKSDTFTTEINVTPGQVYLEKITVNNIPFSNVQGAGWDIASGPDIVIQLIQGNRVLASRGPIQDVAPLNMPITWSIRDPLKLEDWSKSHILRFTDEDSFTAGDLVGETAFLIDNLIQRNGYTNTMEIEDKNLHITYSLSLKWM